jgi:hypothetical protein
LPSVTLSLGAYSLLHSSIDDVVASSIPIDSPHLRSNLRNTRNVGFSGFLIRFRFLDSNCCIENSKAEKRGNPVSFASHPLHSSANLRQLRRQESKISNERNAENSTSDLERSFVNVPSQKRNLLFSSV